MTKETLIKVKLFYLFPHFASDIHDKSIEIFKLSVCTFISIKFNLYYRTMIAFQILCHRLLGPVSSSEYVNMA